MSWLARWCIPDRALRLHRDYEWREIVERLHKYDRQIKWR